MLARSFESAYFSEEMISLAAFLFQLFSFSAIIVLEYSFSQLRFVKTVSRSMCRLSMRKIFFR